MISFGLTTMTTETNELKYSDLINVYSLLLHCFNAGIHSKVQYDTIDDLHWKTDKQAASLV